MTPKKKSCIKCAFLGDKGTYLPSMHPVVKPIPIRDGGKIPRIKGDPITVPIELTCYHGFWAKYTGGFAKYQQAVEKSESENPNDEIIYSTHLKVLNLSEHSCKYFTHFNTLGAQSLDRLSERQQEATKTRRAWVGIVIGATAASFAAAAAGALSTPIITFFSGN